MELKFSLLSLKNFLLITARLFAFIAPKWSNEKKKGNVKPISFRFQTLIYCCVHREFFPGIFFRLFCLVKKEVPWLV
jgi:hypothetical protein